MKTTMLVLFFIITAFGCGTIDRQVAAIKGHSKICVDGVEYIQFTSGASVAYTVDGKIKACN